jgi:hypothetical protein
MQVDTSPGSWRQRRTWWQTVLDCVAGGLQQVLVHAALEGDGEEEDGDDGGRGGIEQAVERRARCVGGALR